MDKVNLDVKTQLPIRTVLEKLEEALYTATSEEIADLDLLILHRIVTAVEKKFKEAGRIVL